MKCTIRIPKELYQLIEETDTHIILETKVKNPEAFPGWQYDLSGLSIGEDDA